MRFGKKVLEILLVALLAATTLPAVAHAQSPSPSSSGPQPAPVASPTQPPLAVTLLNPSTKIDAIPRISDLNDGTDEAFRIVAGATVTTNSVVEAYFTPIDSLTGNELTEVTIGLMQPVPGHEGVYERYWDIPGSVPDGPGVLTVRVYQDTIDGFEERGSDSIDVEVDRTADPSVTETVSLKWPQTGGALGFYRPSAGAWRTVLDVTKSAGATSAIAYYSTTPIGGQPKFTRCGNIQAGKLSIVCTLSALDVPSSVTMIAVIPEVRQAEQRTALGAIDATVVSPFLQEPERMNIEFVTETLRALKGSACLAFQTKVTDELGRPVAGANVDLHAQGPTDQLQLRDRGAAPDSVPHVTQVVERRCPALVPIDLNRILLEGTEAVAPTTVPLQSEHNVPGHSDIKHIELKNGSGLEILDTPLPIGVNSWLVISNEAGFTDLSAWIDDEDVANETDQRPPDNDGWEEGEPMATARAQWLNADIKISADPLGTTGGLGQCVPYTIKARSGRDAVPSINVDVHVSGPGVQFCDPEGATPRRSPDKGEHTSADEMKGSHEQQAPVVDHTEGETDEVGNFVVGVTSTEPGDTTLSAWIDGEKGLDDDVQDGIEAFNSTVTVTTNWVADPTDLKLSFLSPSGFGAGGGNRLSFFQDADNDFDIAVRVGYPGSVPGVEIQREVPLNSGTWAGLGTATQIPGTDTYELSVRGLAAGIHKLRAIVPGTGQFVERQIEVGQATDNPLTPNDDAWDSAELTNPANGARLSFFRGAATLSGIASSGAEGIDLFYAKTGAKDTPGPTDWITCGYADLSGTTAGPQAFSGRCELQGSDQPHQVSAVAASTYDCTVAGCDAAPPPPPAQAGLPRNPRSPGQNESGDANRVFGFDGDTLVAIEPAESALPVGDCHVFVLYLADQTGQRIPRANVDLHLSHPDDAASFCASEEVGMGRSPDGGGHTPTESDAWVHADPAAADVHHIEGETLPDGSFAFGVTSAAIGDSLVSGWYDMTDDDVVTEGEKSDSALVHWFVPSVCTIVGTRKADVVKGTPERDVICGRGGADVISGLGGNDLLIGGYGPDVLRGGGGRDVLRGGPGRDRLNAGPGGGVCRGGPGKDLSRRCGG